MIYQHQHGNFRTTIEDTLSGYVVIQTQNAADEIKKVSIPKDALLGYVASKKIEFLQSQLRAGDVGNILGIGRK